MQPISGQLEDMRRKIMGQSYVTPAEKSLSDDLLWLIEIVACVNNRLDRVDGRHTVRQVGERGRF